jgi:hypothetical protein
MGSYILPAQTIKEDSAYQDKWYVQKQREGKKVIYQEAQAYLVLDSGA